MSWRFLAQLFAAFALISLGASCTSVDRRHQVVISIPEQRMALLEDGAPLATYPVSTSKFGLGDIPGSSGTPLGALEVAQKIGGGAPSGAVFKDRRRTGEIVRPMLRDAIRSSPASSGCAVKSRKMPEPIPALSTSTARPRSGTSDFRSATAVSGCAPAT